MLIFIDDSGDPGFKIGAGSSPTFVIALVIFDDYLDAEETAVRIKRLRRELRFRDDFEFRFNKCSREIRCAFLNAVSDQTFRIRAIVIPKDRITNPGLKESHETFYNYAIKLVLQNHGGTITGAKLRLDGHGNRELKNSLSTYLRRELNSPRERVFDDLKFRDSKEDVLIQLADMVAGSIRRNYDALASDADVYRGIIKKKEQDVWVFGKGST
ncbi:MAG: DUF3800 domain-containing protein [Candidatus Paceibacterota bacterium]